MFLTLLFNALSGRKEAIIYCKKKSFLGKSGLIIFLTTIIASIILYLLFQFNFKDIFLPLFLRTILTIYILSIINNEFLTKFSNGVGEFENIFSYLSLVSPAQVSIYLAAIIASKLNPSISLIFLFIQLAFTIWYIKLVTTPIGLMYELDKKKTFREVTVPMVILILLIFPNNTYLNIINLI